MNWWEKLILGVLQAAPSTIPIFVHSQHGIAIANASENLLAGVLQQFAPPAPPAPPVNPNPAP